MPSGKTRYPSRQAPPADPDRDSLVAVPPNAGQPGAWLTGRCCNASAVSLRSIKPTWPCKTRLNRNHPDPLEAHGPVKVSPAHTVVKACWSGLPPSRGRPQRRRLVAVDLPTSGDPDHAAPWVRFLVASCLRLRSSSTAVGASSASLSPRVRPGSPFDEHAQPHLAAPSTLVITCPTENAPRRPPCSRPHKTPDAL